ncbi:MAG: kelch repeat-containing protein, partial [Actinomycetota bacterium]|nr:kelch repeat-containing protein [Actinomycetota bacterium]
IAPAGVRPAAVTTGATQYQAPGLVPVPSTTSRPGARLYAAGAYDGTHNLDILFGGHTSAGATAGDTWTWDGTTWTLKAPATSPPARDGATMAYDTATGTTILFGGFGTGYLNDTWSWNGTTWTHLTPATSPPARRWASMAYDPALGKIVLFGGCSTGGYLNDTWLWNGTTWASVTTPPALTARDDVGLSYDQTAGNMVLYGGLTGTSTYLGDTWLYGSGGWTQASPVHYPGARGGMGFAYDPTLGRNVLFGGVDATSTYNDQWMWDGSDWRQGIVPTAWGQDANEVFLTGAGNGQLMIQGGYDWAAAGYYDGTGLYDWASGGAPKSNTLTTHPVDDRSTVSMNPFASTARVSATDYAESSVGQALNVSRDYNFNYGGYYGSVGWGWTLTSGIDTYVLGGFPDSSLMLVGLRGAAYANYFHYNGSAYVSPPGLNADLAAISGGWTLTYHASSEKLTFNSSGLMTKDVDRNGNGITVAYDVNNFIGAAGAFEGFSGALDVIGSAVGLVAFGIGVGVVAFGALTLGGLALGGYLASQT